MTQNETNDNIVRLIPLTETQITQLHIVVLNKMLELYKTQKSNEVPDKFVASELKELSQLSEALQKHRSK